MSKFSSLKHILLLTLAFSGITIGIYITSSRQGLPIDDAYIFKRYAIQLAEGRGFCFNSGEPSLGVSSVLWTWVLALLVKIFGKEHYFFLAQFAGMTFYALAIFLLLLLLKKKRVSFELILLGAFFCWLAPITFMNAISGMESGLFAFLVLLNIFIFDLICEKRGKAIGLILGLAGALAFMTRPEGIYFVGVSGVLLLPEVFVFRKKEKKVFLWFLLGVFFIIPYLAWLWLLFGKLMPYTYYAKIYSADPALFERTFFKKLTDGLIFLAGGWWALIKPWILVGVFIFIIAFAEGLGSLKRFFQKGERAGYVLAFGWMFLPFAYGFNFPISPHFGGYYQRYISSVWLVMIFLFILGLNDFGEWFKNKSRTFALIKTPLSWVLFLLIVIYSFPIVKFQLKEGKKIYEREVELNQILRYQSALWIKKHTPKDAKILVGDTGLGVVGGECGRYVYDLGGLINLDILPYLKGTLPFTKKRWKQVVAYICKHKIDYYVGFALRWQKEIAQTSGIIEAKRLGKSGKPSSLFDQIRIYKIDHNAICEENKEMFNQGVEK